MAKIKVLIFFSVAGLSFVVSTIKPLRVSSSFFGGSLNESVENMDSDRVAYFREDLHRALATSDDLEVLRKKAHVWYGATVLYKYKHVEWIKNSKKQFGNADGWSPNLTGKQLDHAYNLTKRIARMEPQEAIERRKLASKLAPEQ